MTISSSPLPPADRFAAPTGTGPSGLAAVGIALLAGVVVLGLFVAGVTFIGLAIAFPIAIPVAAQFHVPVSAADAALAARFADFAWVFAGFALASLTGAVVVFLKAIEKLSPTAGD
jgi:hypothetical protein